MCNLYHIAPPAQLELFFRAASSEPPPPADVYVGPYGPGMFLRPSAGGGLVTIAGQWGMIDPDGKVRRPHSKTILTNNARIESIAQRKSYRRAWHSGQRCLIPAVWYQEPNWETGKNIWWRMRTADGSPWAIAGLWSEWTDPETGELLPSYTMITVNCNSHPLLSRLHKPDPRLPADAQDKRAVVHIPRERWDTWLRGTTDAALRLLVPAPMEDFDLTDMRQTDKILDEMAAAKAAADSSQGTLL